MEKLFEIDSYLDFELVIHKIIHNVTYCTNKADKTQTAIDFNEFKAAEDEVRRLLFDNNFDMKKVGEDMAHKNWAQDRVKCFLSLLDKENIKLLHASLNHHISGYGEAVTQSDWSLKFILGTSDLNSIKNLILQLELSTVDSNGIQRRKLYELNKNAFRKAIESLEVVLED